MTLAATTAPDDLTQWGVADLHEAYVRGETDPVQVVRAYLKRIERLDPALRAFIHVATPTAMAQAEASARRWAQGQALGPLDGVPLGLKDNIEVAGMPCTAGTAAYADRRPERQAPAWQALADAGAVLLGKLNMHEAALGATTDNPVYGRCINPLRAGYTPGGSSGGSAAAVAAHLCAASLGTDTLGSVRIPAAYCGLFGLTASHGTVSMQGIVPLSPTLDTLGPLARSGRDLSIVAAALLQQALPAPVRWQGLRVGWLPQMQAVELTPAARAAWDATRERLQALGATLHPVQVPGWEPARRRLDALLMSEWEGAAYWLDAVGTSLPGLSTDLVKMLRYGHTLDATRRQRAQAGVLDMRAQAQPCFESVDVLLLPTTPQGSFAHGDPVPASQADFTALANLLGVPALAFPCPVQACSGDDLPASCQFLAAPGDDARLLSIAQSMDVFWA
jgi:aspartyl-tRNA(Asn)/glutamyl-tRNA(Gln) amidotransferase subunit A